VQQTLIIDHHTSSDLAEIVRADNPDDLDVVDQAAQNGSTPGTALRLGEVTA
jgi:hypothetical protein